MYSTKRLRVIYQLITVSLIHIFISSCTKDETLENISNHTIEQNITPAVPNSYIVVFKDEEKLRRNKVKMVEKTSGILTKYKISSKNLKFVYETALQGFNIDNVTKNKIELLKKDPNIEIVIPNYIEHLEYEEGKNQSPPTPEEIMSGKKTTNGYYDSLGDWVDWGVARIGGYTYSVGKTAWIIDSGVIATNELNIDYNRSTTFIENDWTDRSGHGTHVAGIIGAKHNGYGSVGVAPGATIVAVKVLDKNGYGTQASILAGINYVANNASYGDVWNYSIGYSQRTINTAYEIAFRNLAKVTFGAMAAGNNNDDVYYYSPQRAYISGAWVVGNHTYQDYAASSSSYGDNVHIWAPGSGIWSTGINGDTFAQKWGTSMASPHVAAILLIRGNGFVGTDGILSKGGYTESILYK